MPPPALYIIDVTPILRGGLARIAAGDTVTLHGTDFAPAIPVHLLVRGPRGDVVPAGEITPGPNGAFIARITASGSTGRRVVSFEQRDGNRHEKRRVLSA
jgi:hypothetical protein